MQNDFDNNDFERFVKQNADQYRMYPSERVWKGINSSIHTRRTWYGLGFILLILASVIVTWMMVSSPEVKQQVNNNSSLTPSALKNQPQKETHKSTVHEFIGSVSSMNEYKFPESLPVNHSEADLQNNPILIETADRKLNDPLTSHTIHATDISYAVISNENATQEQQNTIRDMRGFLISDQATDNNFNPAEITETPDNIFNSEIPKAIYPLTIESIVNSYTHSVIHKKIKWQLAITPTVSYRRLSENKSFLRNASIASGNYNYAYLYNVNSVVTHKPDMGFQIGLLAGYPLTKNMKIRAGVQFNINRYGIKAFSYSNEVATIAFNSNRGKDSLNEITQYRNFNGYRSSWLQNFYFSVSAPIGVEYNFAGNNNTQFGIAGTIQPTYIISDKAYLISTDYKNYVEVPWLVRRWNMNTGLEMYINYSTGNVNWQMGPQVRYQLLSSFQNKYPVKENLFDFGFKVGIMLNK